MGDLKVGDTFVISGRPVLNPPGIGDLTPVNLRAACEHWQQVLRLQDWDIRLELCPPSDIGADAIGRCLCSPFKRSALIKLLDPRFTDVVNCIAPDDVLDWESTLVHELLHLVFPEHDIGMADFDQKDARWLAIERGIDRLSKTLVTLNRWHQKARREPLPPIIVDWEGSL